MSGPYCRVYWSIRTDERFVGVYHDDAALASWLRLLIAAEGVYPAPADIPAWLKPDVLELLVDRGLIEVIDSFHYRVHGLESERERRSKAGATAANVRWGRNADAYAGALLAEQSRDEQSKDEQTRERADVEAFLLVRRRLPTPAQRKLMDAYCRTFDVTGPERAERLILAHPDDPIGALKADLDAFRAERLAALPPEPVRKPRPSGLRGASAELAAMLRERDDAEAEARFLQPINPDPVTAIARASKEAAS